MLGRRYVNISDLHKGLAFSDPEIVDLLIATGDGVLVDDNER